MFVSKNMTQKNLADMLGKKESEISKWMSGTHNFTLKTIAKIESVLNVCIINTNVKQTVDKVFIFKMSNTTFIKPFQKMNNIFQNKSNLTYFQIQNIQNQ